MTRKTLLRYLEGTLDHDETCRVRERLATDVSLQEALRQLQRNFSRELCSQEFFDGQISGELALSPENGPPSSSELLLDPLNWPQRPTPHSIVRRKKTSLWGERPHGASASKESRFVPKRLSLSQPSSFLIPKRVVLTPKDTENFPAVVLDDQVSCSDEQSVQTRESFEKDPATLACETFKNEISKNETFEAEALKSENLETESVENDALSQKTLTKESVIDSVNQHVVDSSSAQAVRENSDESPESEMISATTSTREYSQEERYLSELLGRPVTKKDLNEYYWEEMDDSDSEPKAFAGGIKNLLIQPVVLVGHAAIFMGHLFRRKIHRPVSSSAQEDMYRPKARKSLSSVYDIMIAGLAGILIAVFVVFPTLKFVAGEVYRVIAKSAFNRVNVSIDPNNEEDVLQVLYPNYSSFQESEELFSPDDSSEPRILEQPSGPGPYQDSVPLMDRSIMWEGDNDPQSHSRPSGSLSNAATSPATADESPLSLGEFNTSGVSVATDQTEYRNSARQPLAQPENRPEQENVPSSQNSEDSLGMPLFFQEDLKNF